MKILIQRHLPFLPDDRGLLIRCFNSEHLNLGVEMQMSNSLEVLLCLQKNRFWKIYIEVSHNLMTPIMSISGAATVLEDLVDEYKDSIGDKDVTNEDHHEIS